MPFNPALANGLEAVKQRMVEQGVPERCGAPHPRLAGVTCERFGRCPPGYEHRGALRTRADGEVASAAKFWREPQSVV